MIVCVVVATAAMYSLVRLAMGQRVRVEAESRRLQCVWLAESALDRAAWRLAADPKYPGETWKVAADALGGTDPAVVLIQVEPLPEQPMRRLVRVRADYPDHPIDRVRLSKQAVVGFPSTGEKK